MFAHQDRPMKLTTPFGADALILTAVRGREALSELFHFELEVVLEDTHKPFLFEQLLGQEVTAEFVHTSGKRSLQGIVIQITQGDAVERFMPYRLEVVPRLWMLTRRHRSRIFQQKSIPQVLQEVFTGLDVSYQIQGDFEPREYCVQYRETDFHFASRLMEEEGIYYFFKQPGDSLVLANTPQSHPEIPYQGKVVYETMSGHTAQEDRVHSWLKSQEIRSVKYLLWDETFEMPGKHLEAEKPVAPSVSVGRVVHKLDAGTSGNEEIYDFPGGYAHRFDSVSSAGGDQSDHLQKIFTDNVRTVGIRMQQETLPALSIHGQSGHAGFTAGHTFELNGHPTDSAKFVLTSVEHDAHQPIGTGKAAPYTYQNQFEAIPVTLPFRPIRKTRIPMVHGVQTATVVGPANDEIFTDKYGRVKVQFPWDREGKNDASSSCWIRVGTHWAGKHWGAIHIPRIGQEVIVDFVEGDVDRPIVVGSVYNADMMPPYQLPDKKTVSTLKSRSTLKGADDNYNEFRFEDLKGKEQIFLHAERDQDVRVKAESRTWVGANSHQIVKQNQKEKVEQDKHSTIGGKYLIETGGDQHINTKGNVCEKVGANRDSTVGGNQVEKIGGKNDVEVGGDHNEKVGGTMSLTVSSSLEEKSGTKFAHEAGQEIHLKAGMKVILEAGMQLTIKGPGGFVDIGPSGVTIQGIMVLINSGGAAGSGSGSSPSSPGSPKTPDAPEAPDEADDGTKFDKK